MGSACGKIWITGAVGFLGARLARAFAATGFEVVGRKARVLIMPDQPIFPEMLE